MDKYIFGNRLYELRTQNNLTQKQLAMYLGVSNKAVSKWETGEAMPRVKTLQAIAQCFGITYSDLLSEFPSEEKLPPYEVYYRNKIEAKEASFVKEYKQNLLVLFFFVFVKILFYLFNSVFIKVNILYSIGSIFFITAFFIFYYKYKNKLVKNIKSADYYYLDILFCCLSVTILHSILDNFVFYKYDLIGGFTLVLHIIPLAFIFVFYLMVKKDCYKLLLQIVGGVGVFFSIGYLGVWLVKGTSAIHNYVDNLLPLHENNDAPQFVFVVLIAMLLTFLNIISIAIYGLIIFDFGYISDILITKLTKIKDEDTLNKKYNKIVTIVLLIIVSVTIIWLFSILFRVFNILEYWNDFFNK